MPVSPERSENMNKNRPKPKGLRVDYASQFKDASVASAYRFRPPYPSAVFPLLSDLVIGDPRRVLDAGCGTGFVARPLARHVDQIDAVDFSKPMLEIARTLPGGDRENLRWFHGALENIDLDSPYGLVTAGESLHWMEWSSVLPRFRHLLHPGGFVALVGTASLDQVPWWQELLPVIQRFSTNRDFKPYDTVKELSDRGLFAVKGSARTEPETFTQSVFDYVESFHARNGFSRERMRPDHAAAFDAAVAAIVAPYAPDGMLSFRRQGTLVWGIPDPSG